MKICVRDMSEDVSERRQKGCREDMCQRYVRRCVRENVRRYVSERMAEDMAERMSQDMSERMS